MCKKGGQKISIYVEQLVIDLCCHFDKSSKHKDPLKEYQEFCSVKIQKILKHSSMRWLPLMKCVDRVLRQYDALNSYFSSCAPEKKNKEESKETLFLDGLNNPMTNVYKLFLHSVLPIIDSFTGLLECKEPMIHKVGECINT